MELSIKISRSVAWLILVILAAAFGWRLYKRHCLAVKHPQSQPQPEPTPVSQPQPQAEPSAARYTVGVDVGSPDGDKTAFSVYDTETGRIVETGAGRYGSVDAKRADQHQQSRAGANGGTSRRSAFGVPRKTREELDREAMQAGLDAMEQWNQRRQQSPRDEGVATDQYEGAFTSQ